MKGGPSVDVLLDLALGNDETIARKASEVLKTQVFLYEADLDRLRQSYNAGNTTAKDVLESYAKAEFFTNLPDIDDEIQIVTYVAAEGDISTDLLSPGNQAHSRSDRELHGKSMISEKAQQEIRALQAQHPDKQVMLIAEKGTMGVGSSRMSGVNNVALWTGKQASPYIPFVNIAPIVGGTNGISPIFQTALGVTGGIGIDLKNWVKKLDSDGNPILNNDGNPILEQRFSVDTGTVFKINTKDKKMYDALGKEELVDATSSFTPMPTATICPSTSSTRSWPASGSGPSSTKVLGLLVLASFAKNFGRTRPRVRRPSWVAVAEPLARPSIWATMTRKRR